MSDEDDMGFEDDGEDVDAQDVDAQDIAVEDADHEEQSGETDALLSRLRVIEDQPLESRAAAFAQVYDELQVRLENGETSRGHA
jgi:hypothetical protein